jgi:arsenate reductase (thioredoxin)
MNMGYMDKDWSATTFLHNLKDWGIEDPRGKPIEKVREIRDEIEQRVKELTASLGRNTNQ